jgi:ribosomal protein S18 acetylase RimI-like enzyme
LQLIAPLGGEWIEIFQGLMAMRDTDYTHSEAEFKEMRELLAQSYLVSRKPLNWRLAMAENWNYASRYLEPIEYFASRVHLWRSDTGKLISFLIRDSSLIYLQVDYSHRDAEARMADWAERHWAGNNTRIGTMVYDWDIERQRLLAQRRYENHGAIEDVRIFDLFRAYPKAVLPPGFTITSLAEYDHYLERIDLENSIWGANLTEAWLRGKSSAPSYSPKWDLIVVAPDGKLAAQSLVWLYPKSQMGEIDPLGTHPEYRKRGLAKALVLESFKRMRNSGVHYAYIASDAKDPIVSHLYTSLQPGETYQGYHWTKQLSEGNRP